VTLKRPQDQTLLAELYWAGVHEVQPQAILPKYFNLKGNDLHIGAFSSPISQIERIWILGAGKAAASMAQIAEEFFLGHLEKKYAGGMVITKEGHEKSLKRIECLTGGHPIPNSRGEKAATKLLHSIETMSAKDLLVFLLSGGASALMPMPSDGISLADKIKLNEILLKSALNIHEINTLRKHCSQIKGGHLVQKASKIPMVTLAISDIPGDVAEMIGSGPTLADSTTLKDCWEIIQKYNLDLPATILNHLKKGSSETPKPQDPIFKKNSFQIIGRNQDAIKAAQDWARKKPGSVVSENHFFTENIIQVAKNIAILKERYDGELKKPYVLITGGEPTVKINNPGKGGRNMELALHCAQKINGKFTFLSAGTDGTDGPTEAAGAFVDETTRTRANEKSLDLNRFLDQNNSYNFFKTLEDLFIPGPTGTNVMDMHVLIVHE
jgi:glycerate-2-kinase